MGCGTGRDLNTLLEMGNDAIGIDPCAELLAQAAQKHVESAKFVAPKHHFKPSKPDFEAIILENEAEKDGFRVVGVFARVVRAEKNNRAGKVAAIVRRYSE